MKATESYAKGADHFRTAYPCQGSKRCTARVPADSPTRLCPEHEEDAEFLRESGPQLKTNERFARAVYGG